MAFDQWRSERESPAARWARRAARTMKLGGAAAGRWAGATLLRPMGRMARTLGARARMSLEAQGRAAVARLGARAEAVRASAAHALRPADPAPADGPLEARLKTLGEDLRIHGSAISGGAFAVGVLVAAFLGYAALFGHPANAYFAIALVFICWFLNRVGAQLTRLGDAFAAEAPKLLPRPIEERALAA